MTRNPYAIIWLPAAPADLLALNAADERLADVALAALDDIAHHRQCGKQLSKRNVSGDLTGRTACGSMCPATGPHGSGSSTG